MTQFRPFVVLASLFCTLSLAQAPGRVSAPAPVKDYTVSFFSDLGYPWVRVVGATADLRTAGQVTLGDTVIEVYNGEETRLLETVITSPLAVLQPESRLITGPEFVNLKQSNLELSGEDWTYEYLGPHEHRVHLRRNARIVFNATIADLLK